MISKFVPSVCDGEGKEFEGYVEVEELFYEDRLVLVEQLELPIGEDGEIDMKMKDSMKYIGKLVKSSIPFVKKVELKRLSDGVEFKSYDELRLDGNNAKVIIEIASRVVNGAGLGKQKS